MLRLKHPRYEALIMDIYCIRWSGKSCFVNCKGCEKIEFFSPDQGFKYQSDISIRYQYQTPEKKAIIWAKTSLSS